MESIASMTTSTGKKDNRCKIRVLWFATSPSLGRVHLDKDATLGTSWIEALERLCLKDSRIELAIAFTWKSTSIDSFVLDSHRTRYYTIPRRPKNKWTRALRRVLSLPEHSQDVADDCVRIAHEFKPDIVTFFGTETPYPLSIPQLHCPHLIWFQGNLTVYQKKWHVGISPIQSLLGASFKDLVVGHSYQHYYQLYRHYVAREKKIFALSQNFLGRTDWDRRLVSMMAPHAQYFHGEEAMRPAFFTKAWNKGRDEHKVTLVSTFRDSLYKGLETAMEAFVLLNQVASPIVKWKIIGVASDSSYARTCRKSVGFKGDENFQLLGLKSAEELATELIDADIFVHPSHIDNSPNSLCEAMLLGVPCVSTNVGGIPSLLKNGIDGLLVQDGDPFALAGSILDLINNPTYARQLGQGARERSLQRHDGDEIKDNLLDIYHQIITQSVHNPEQDNS
ncbi:MAG: glycosyltransferase family 4 protein [Saprospiraceae bacterium]|nr:glycosyltransferase family 4 protein [Saprospiraceae bacterium]